MRNPTAGELRPGSIQALKSSLDGRFWLVAVVGTAVAGLLLGVPTSVIPNPFFTRMTPTETFNVLIWLGSTPLLGLLTATYVRPSNHPLRHEAGEQGAGPATIGGLAAFLAIGCPICNKIVVAALGVGGALNVFAPVQPLIGAASLALLGATLTWRLRDRANRCERCAL